METRTVSCWHVGQPDLLGPGDGVVAFTAGELDEAAARGAQVVAFHDAMDAPGPRAPMVEIHVPSYRSRSLIPVLSWLATRLGTTEAEVSWYLGRKQGADSVRRLLEGLGWVLGKERYGRDVRLHGPPPAVAELPEPAGFTAQLGACSAWLAADYGVFSPGRVDDGTALLLDVALSHGPVEAVADIGIGYGPLAIGLVLNSLAGEGTGTDVDCVALWLARRNASNIGVALSLTCTADPASVAPTALTVCNIPTHINASQSARLMHGLAQRAERGALLVVVHASLEGRYERHLSAARLRVTRHAGPAHVVLEAFRQRH